VTPGALACKQFASLLPFMRCLIFVLQPSYLYCSYCCRSCCCCCSDLLGDSVFGDICCIIVGLTIVLGIRLSGLKVSSSFWPPS